LKRTQVQCRAPCCFDMTLPKNPAGTGRRPKGRRRSWGPAGCLPFCRQTPAGVVPDPPDPGASETPVAHTPSLAVATGPPPSCYQAQAFSGVPAEHREKLARKRLPNNRVVVVGWGGRNPAPGQTTQAFQAWPRVWAAPSIAATTQPRRNRGHPGTVCQRSRLASRSPALGAAPSLRGVGGVRCSRPH